MWRFKESLGVYLIYKQGDQVSQLAALDVDPCKLV